MPTTTEATARSFEEYAAATWPSLYRRAYLLSGNHADAEDLAQETLVKVQAAWTRVSRAESSEAYVRRILTNTFLSSRRARGRRPELLVGEDPPEPDVAPPAGPEDRLALWPHVRAPAAATASRHRPALLRAAQRGRDRRHPRVLARQREVHRPPGPAPPAHRHRRE